MADVSRRRFLLRPNPESPTRHRELSESQPGDLQVTNDQLLTSEIDVELEYLRSQRLGRLATVAPDGAPQNNPVGFRYNAEANTIDIGGLNMGATRKFRNVQRTGKVAFVVDDIASLQPWRVRGVEIRGEAEALDGQPREQAHFSGEIIRIHPRRIISWGLPSSPSSVR